MKKILSAALSAAMLLSLAACGKKDSTTDSQTTAAKPETTASAAQTTGSSAETGSTAASAENGTAAENKAEPAVPGVLYQLNAEEGEEPVIKGLSLIGNSVGSSDPGTGINSLPVSAENIRSIFLLNEWISFYPDTEKTSGLSVYAVPHEEKAETLVDSFIAALSEDVVRTELRKPEEDGSEWGSFYLNPDTWQPGYYDLVFTSGLKPVARVMVKLYPDGGLEGKSDEELKQIMNSEIAAAKAKS